jgi:hypothetical protein
LCDYAKWSIRHVRSFIHQWHFSPLLGLGLFFSCIIFFTQTARRLGRGISPSHGRYLHTGQHKHRIKAHSNIHALSGIRTHDSSVQARENSSCLRWRGHCDRHQLDTYRTMNWIYGKMNCGAKWYKWGNNQGLSYIAPSLSSLIEINWNMLREKNINELQNFGKEISWEADIWRTVGG